jgi:predicted ATPase
MAIERYVLTGGTYAGKSTLIDYLKSEGFSVFPEAIIASRNELKSQGVNHHKEPYRWMELIEKKTIEYYESAKDGKNFYDRGMPCAALFAKDRAPLSYERTLKLAHSMQYSSPVFLLETIKPFTPHWNDIPENANLILEEETRAIYKNLGYQLADIPFLTIDISANNLRRKELILKLCSEQID